MSEDKISEFYSVLHEKYGLTDFSGPRMIQHSPKLNFDKDKEAIAHIFNIEAFTEEEIDSIEGVAREMKKIVSRGGNSLTILFPF